MKRRPSEPKMALVVVAACAGLLWPHAGVAQSGSGDDVATRKVGVELMVSLRAFAEAMHKSINVRKDVYRDDIVYLEDRPSDLSAQTIAYVDEKVGRTSMASAQ